MNADPCHWTGEERAHGPKHDGPHDQCEPCEHRHCTQCGRTHIDDPDTHRCARCIGRTRVQLSEIGAMHGRLEDEAIHHPNDPIPGGTATVMLAPGSLGESQQWAETQGWDTTHKRDELSSDPASVALTLTTWEDAARDILGVPERARPPTVARAVEWLTRNLTDLAQNDAWPTFADDIRTTHHKLENVLGAGNRPVHGARCLTLECDGELLAYYREPAPCQHDTEAKRTARALVRRRHAGQDPSADRTEPVPTTGQIRAALRAARKPCQQCDQGGRRDERKCTHCGRVYTEDDYHRANTHDANQHKPRTLTDIARTLGVKRDRVKKWVTRGKLQPKGRTPRGVAEYDIREARRLAMRSDVA